MCRAVWVLVAAPDAASARAVQRAVGAEAQVVAVATSVEEALADVTAAEPDVVVLAETLDDAASVAEQAAAAGKAVVWIGERPPPAAGATLPDASISEALPGAIVTALIARRRAGG